MPSHSAELELALADWGVTLTHLAVTPAFNPTTQTLTESTVATELQGIAGPLEAERLPKLPGQQQQHRRTFLIRTTDWPVLADGACHRVLFDEVTYDVTEITTSETAGWVRITSIRRD